MALTVAALILKQFAAGKLSEIKIKYEN